MSVQHGIASFEDYISSLGANTSLEFAQALDSQKELASFRDEFEFPTIRSCGGTRSLGGSLDDKCVYLCTNSLGLMPTQARNRINEDLDVWAREGVFAHHSNKYGNPWVSVEDTITPKLEKVVGGLPGEVTAMNSLTVNAHLLFGSFYQPTETRFKVVMEAGSFPSDYYAVRSHLKMRGVDPDLAVIEIHPREGEDLIRTEDIIKTINDNGQEIALIWFAGVQYYTGQVFDMELITKIGHENGCMVGLDLAHAAGNIVLKLHDWNVDFAVWCHYKYMCSCAGALAGAFVHNKYARDFERNRLTGWWAHNLDTRFVMDNKMDLAEGIDGFRVSNQSVISAAAVRAALDVFDKTSMEALRARSLVLTGYLEYLLNAMENTSKNIRIMTPKNPNERGAQLSLVFTDNTVDDVFNYLKSYGIIADIRRPIVIRVAPAPLFSTFEDVWKFVTILNQYQFK
ncbi:hypothetical protein BB561_003833 [Smittium simulii]|uniref:Kynureninase n=1 Tax=Smittium simulii TaxID=133385 RepID=A0A2T9YJ84_9FUNG|nr:hypothetical protein BB561_003833 [Smittium simulii]